MKTPQIAKLYQQYAIPVYNRLGIAAVRAKGSWLWDQEGKRYLDFFPGWGVGALGHCHPHVVKKVQEQVKCLIHVPNTLYNEPQAKLAKALNNLGFRGKAFFVSSGAEAVEAAIKLARKYGHPDRWEIITMERSFHGRTMGALAATGQAKHKKGFEPMLPGFRHVPFNDLDAVKKALRPETVAVMLELVQGEGGVYVADPAFARSLRDFCDEHKLLLIADEVTTGLGRTGAYYCFQHYGIKPDMVLLAKGAAGGLPLGVLLAAPHISDIWEKASHATTFGGNPLVAAAGLAVVEVIRKKGFLNHVRKQEAYLKKELEKLKARYSAIREIRGKGLMFGIELDRPGLPVVQAALKKKLFINCTQERILRLYPALTVTKEEIDQAVKILGQACQEALT